MTTNAFSQNFTKHNVPVKGIRKTRKGYFGIWRMAIA